MVLRQLAAACRRGPGRRGCRRRARPTPRAPRSSTAVHVVPMPRCSAFAAACACTFVLAGSIALAQGPGRVGRVCRAHAGDDGLDGELAGDLAGAGAAHAVADHEQHAVLRAHGGVVAHPQGVRVLVAGALAADVGRAGDEEAFGFDLVRYRMVHGHRLGFGFPFIPGPGDGQRIGQARQTAIGRDVRQTKSRNDILGAARRTVSRPPARGASRGGGALRPGRIHERRAIARGPGTARERRQRQVARARIGPAQPRPRADRPPRRRGPQLDLDRAVRDDVAHAPPRVAQRRVAGRARRAAPPAPAAADSPAESSAPGGSQSRSSSAPSRRATSIRPPRATIATARRTRRRRAARGRGRERLGRARARTRGSRGAPGSPRSAARAACRRSRPAPSAPGSSRPASARRAARRRALPPSPTAPSRRPGASTCNGRAVQRASTRATLPSRTGQRARRSRCSAPPRSCSGRRPAAPRTRPGRAGTRPPCSRTTARAASCRWRARR